MSTTAMIVFRDGDEFYWIRRGHDGFPDIVLPDLNRVLGASREGFGGRWSGAECGQLVSLFLAMLGDASQRLQPYELAPGLPGDESYVYSVEYIGRYARGRWYAYLEIT